MTDEAKKEIGIMLDKLADLVIFGEIADNSEKVLSAIDLLSQAIEE